MTRWTPPEARTTARSDLASGNSTGKKLAALWALSARCGPRLPGLCDLRTGYLGEVFGSLSSGRAVL
jgi:hypothetical protein